MCRDCGKYFLADASYHHYSGELREEALRGVFSNSHLIR
ncbi:hypothetical protein J5U22_01485 [Saccharolobus shibatae]|uniref:Uncharacterized protein n=1 Tax=Saccharolobus shibatae TaxID=2286 RepID=A0A8F5C0S1_9CREN|nr:hypothetical protein J5U22_01485 [Saccharolobus shibatae]